MNSDVEITLCDNGWLVSVSQRLSKSNSLGELVAKNIVVLRREQKVFFLNKDIVSMRTFLNIVFMDGNYPKNGGCE